MSSLTVGYVFWIARAGYLLSSILSSLPAWKEFDPLPILDRVDLSDSNESDLTIDDSLASLVMVEGKETGDSNSEVKS